MECSQFTPRTVYTTTQDQHTWLQIFWGKVFTNSCVGICESACVTAPLSGTCRTCLQNEILDSDLAATNNPISNSITSGANCNDASTRQCVSALLTLDDASFDQVKTVVIAPDNSLTSGEIIGIVLGTLAGVLLIALIIFYSLKRK